MPQLMNWWYVITRYNQFPQHLKNEGWKGWIVVYYSGGGAVGLKGYFNNGNKITPLLHFVFFSSCKKCERKKINNYKKKSPVVLLVWDAGRWIEKILQPKVALLIWDPGVELERPLGLVVGQVWCNHWGWIVLGPSSSPERSNAICNLSWSMCRSAEVFQCEKKQKALKSLSKLPRVQSLQQSTW